MSCVKQCEAGESLSRKVRQGPYQIGRGRFGRRIYAKQFEAGGGSVLNKAGHSLGSLC